MFPKQLRTLGTAAAVLLGGFFTLNLASTATIGALRFAAESKRVKRPKTQLLTFKSLLRFWGRERLRCLVWSAGGKGFYICKLCKGNATIEWSPLYDPIAINPCLCPTCDGNRVQHCLNCLGTGYN
ncbi:unnamed protein product [Malus baccata var. baccata]